MLCVYLWPLRPALWLSFLFKGVFRLQRERNIASFVPILLIIPEPKYPVKETVVVSFNWSMNQGIDQWGNTNRYFSPEVLVDLAFEWHSILGLTVMDLSEGKEAIFVHPVSVFKGERTLRRWARNPFAFGDWIVLSLVDDPTVWGKKKIGFRIRKWIAAWIYRMGCRQLC